MTLLATQTSALPYPVVIDGDWAVADRTAWCRANVGSTLADGGFQWRGPMRNWHDNNSNTIYYDQEVRLFRSKDAAVMFSLTWGEFRGKMSVW